MCGKDISKEQKRGDREKVFVPLFSQKIHIIQIDK